jgi:hypothetical protein
MEIVVSVKRSPVGEFFPPGPHGPGKVFVFSDNLVLESIDKQKIPGTPEARRAGTHSGTATTLRLTGNAHDKDPGDEFIPGDSLLFQYEATYRLNAVPATPPHALQSGQVTARGVVLQTPSHTPGKRTYAITGGTGAYANARGQVTEPGPPPPGQPDESHLRKLDIVL